MQLITRRRAALVLACLVGAAAPGGVAQAQEVGHLAPADLDRAARTLGPSAQRNLDGSYSVQTADGEVYRLHAPHDSPSAMTAEPDDISLGPEGDLESAPLCRSTGYYTRVLYAHPATSPSQLTTETARIRRIVRRMNYALDENARKSGARAADLPVLCDSAGKVRVDGYYVAFGSAWANVVDAAKQHGYKQPGVHYLIFFDHHEGGCGAAAGNEDDDRLSADNANNQGGHYAVVWDTSATNSCWGTHAALHEWGHALGAVVDSAPGSTGWGHCDEQHDVMCYADGGVRNQTQRYNCIYVEMFDCGFDDYFDAAPEAGEYLSNHWNLGSPLNRFIKFDDTPTKLAERGDFTGDRIADIAVWRPSDGKWYVRNVHTIQFGQSSDHPAQGDYVGDGVMDLATYRPNALRFQAADITAGFPFGKSHTLGMAVPADYDGDGLTNVATYIPSDRMWVIRGVNQVGFGYGEPGDIPVPADYNGDGKDDVAVFRPSNRTWHIQGQTPAGGIAYGALGQVHVPVPADYDGDGDADIAVFRPSNRTWYVRGVTDSAGIAWGSENDIPVPADFTGDGAADIAIFRPSDGTWHIRGKTAIGAGIQYGQAGDIPVSGPVVTRPIMERFGLL